MARKGTRLFQVVIALSSVLHFACIVETFELFITNQSSENIEYIDIEYSAYLAPGHKTYTDADLYLDIGQTDSIYVPIDFYSVNIYGDTLKWGFCRFNDGNAVVLHDEDASVYAIHLDIVNQSSETINEVFSLMSCDCFEYSSLPPDNLLSSELKTGATELIKTEIENNYLFARSDESIWTVPFDNLDVEDTEWILSDTNSHDRRYITVTNLSPEGLTYIEYRGGSPSTDWFKVFTAGCYYRDTLYPEESFTFERLAVPLLGLRVSGDSSRWVFGPEDFPTDFHFILDDNNSQSK